MKKLTLIQKSFLLLVASAIIGFCIITNPEGVYRSYWAEDLPFIIQMNVVTPNSYDEHIQTALDTWNAVEGCYFEFQMGPRTNANSAAGDGINLLYFDNNYDNFSQGSNTIAFSSTRTSTVGGYHAVESDYIYNAAGFPPATDGSPNQMDLITITLHEIGHHMGLSHHGPAGNSNGAGSEGCGLDLPSQVMFWSVALGSQKRSLFLHDEMGAVAIYPNFIITGSITDAETGDPIENAKLVLSEGTYAAYVGPVEPSLSSNRGLRPGEVYTTYPTPDDGSFDLAMNHGEFNFTVSKFGYANEEYSVSLPTPSGYGNTEFESYNIELSQTSRGFVTGLLEDKSSGEPIFGYITLTWVGDENEFFEVETDENGNFSVEVPTDNYYNIIVYLEHPYDPVTYLDSVFIPETGIELDLNIRPSKLVFVYDNNVKQNVFDQYENKLLDLKIGHSIWDINQKGVSPTESDLDVFSHPLTLFWIAGGDTTSNLDNDEIAFLTNHLDNGNRLILTGTNIAEYIDSTSTLLSHYGGVEFNGNASSIALRGIAGDIIGDGISESLFGSKDKLKYSGMQLGNVNQTLYYGSSLADTVNIGGIRSENVEDNWKFVFFAESIYRVPNDGFDSLLVRSIRYCADTNGVSSVEIVNNDIVQNNFSISQNYPNPFNPSTTIKFSLPVNANVSLKIFNILGEQVDVLKEGFMNAGTYELRWNAVSNSISSGIYFYRIEANGINGSNYSQTMKMILLK